MSPKTDALRAQILSLTADYFSEAFPPREFIPGESNVPVSGRVFDASDLQSLMDSSLDFWLTLEDSHINLKSSLRAFSICATPF